VAAPTVIEERSGATFATASPRPRPPTTRRELPSWVAPLIGVVVMVGGWWVVALVWDNPSSLPTPSAVFDFMQENWRNLWDNAWATAQTAKWGWIIGNSIAVFFALIAAIAPVAERFVVRVAVAIYALPFIAISPILQSNFAGDVPVRVITVLAVYFTTLMGALLGLKAADPRSIDVIRALGGGSFTVVRKVRIRAALPAFFAGLRISAPAAVLGAMLGEFMGGQQGSGLGVRMTAARAALDAPAVWAIAFTASALAATGYFLIAFVGRMLTPWAPKGDGGR
jgi:ABC-type nitrate/sulfonate/bicarbonate transport system permease component